MVYVLIFLIVLLCGVGLYFRESIRPHFLKTKFNNFVQNYDLQVEPKQEEKIKHKEPQNSAQNFNLIERLYFIKPALFELARKNNNIFLYNYDDTMPRIYEANEIKIVNLIYKIAEFLSINIVNNSEILITFRTYKELERVMFFNISFKCEKNNFTNSQKIDSLEKEFENPSLPNLIEIKALCNQCSSEIYFHKNATNFTVEIKSKLTIVNTKITQNSHDFKNIDVLMLSNNKTAFSMIVNRLKILGITTKIASDFAQIEKILLNKYRQDLVILPGFILKDKQNIKFIKQHQNSENFAIIIDNPNTQILDKIRIFRINLPFVNDEIETLLMLIIDIANGKNIDE